MMIDMPRWGRGFLLSVSVLFVCGAADSPRAAVDELLAADRAFSAAAAKVDVTAGLSAMFADDVMMPTPGGAFVEGKAAAAGEQGRSSARPRACRHWAVLSHQFHNRKSCQLSARGGG